MLIRIVKLTFTDEGLPKFLSHFETVKYEVSNFPGCQGMRLIQDINQPNLIMTYSTWDSEEALENYRLSPLFETIWPTIKVWFSDKPEAWSFSPYFDGFTTNK